MDPLKNWAGNLAYSTGDVRYPESLDEIVDIVRSSRKIKSLGSQHSFSAIADSAHRQISMKKINSVIELDEQRNTITVGAGIRYGDFCEFLDARGYALHNLASLPHISVAGACATATHGSGRKNGSLSTAIRAVEIVKANGDVVTIDALDPSFPAVTVALGALGVISKVTLEVLPNFQMTQVVYRNMPVDELMENFEAVMSGGYSVSLFTDWQDGKVSEVWIKEANEQDNTTAPSEYYGAILAEKNLHPIEDHSPENCTEQMGKLGTWYERLPHFKMGFTPSSGEELQSEYFVAFEHGAEAMAAIEKMREAIFPHLYISEVRSIAADNYWMSPFYEKDCVAIHFTWKPHWPEVQKLLPGIESALAPFDVLPHWGKLNSIEPSILQSRIKRLADFKELMSDYDPEGKFMNKYLKQKLF